MFERDDVVGHTIATYNTEPQAQYVLDQIALAIERRDKLYRMPSVEEVERVINKCSVCDNDPKEICNFCRDFSMFEPKEQEG